MHSFLSLQTNAVMSPCKNPYPDRLGRQLSHTIPWTSTMQTRESVVLDSMKTPGQTGPESWSKPLSQTHPLFNLYLYAKQVNEVPSISSFKTSPQFCGGV